jgi:hypothetical protein
MVSGIRWRVETDDGPPRRRPQSIAPESSWPEPPAEVAYRGLVGEFLGVVMPDTEADPAAVAATFLAMAGVAIGRGPYVRVGRTQHRTNVFVVIVGRTSIGSKGSSFDHARDALLVGSTGGPHLISGLGSGEGLVDRLRDTVEKVDDDGGSRVVVQGVDDKRALVFEAEMARLLRAASRDGSTLTSYLRIAWDGLDLAVTTRTRPVRATGAHIGALYHVTPDDLRRDLASTDLFNGFANRFLFIASRRSKVLSIPPATEGPAWDAIAASVSRAVHLAPVGRIGLDAEGERYWSRSVVPHLLRDRPPVMEAVVARARPQVLRLALIYAVLDHRRQIGRDDLESAVALWDYSERSAEWLFGDSLGNAEADRILAALREADDGLSRSAIRDLFSRNATEAAIVTALRLLADRGLAQFEKRSPAGRGRPVEFWTPIDRNDGNDGYRQHGGDA